MMKIFNFRIGKRKIQDIIKDIDELLPAELDREQDLLNRLRNLVIFLGSEKHREIKELLGTEKEFLSGSDMPQWLRLKFEQLRGYPFYQDFLRDKNLEKFIENINIFRTNPDLNLTQPDVQSIKLHIEGDLRKVKKLIDYFSELDYNLKSISIPLKVLRRRGDKLRDLYIELKDYIKSESNQKYLRKFNKADITNIRNIAYRKLEEFSYLDKLIALIDEQRVLTRRARHSSFNFKNFESVSYINKIIELEAYVLSYENKRLFGILTFEEWMISEAQKKLDTAQLVLRRNKLRILRNTAIAICSIYSIYGVGITFTLSSMAAFPTAKVQIVQTENLKKQEIIIQSELGNIPAWLFKTNESDKIVLISHALNYNKSYEKPLIDALSGKGYNIITFDFPGHGENISRYFGSATYGINESKIVLRVLSYLEDNGYKEIVLVGRSMGAVSCLKAAAEYKGGIKIKGIAADSAYATTRDPFHHVAQNLLGVVDPLTNIGTYIGGITAGVDLRNMDITKDVKKLTMPIFYQWGELDDKVKPYFSVDVLPQATKAPHTVKIYKGEGHIEFDSQERMNDVVKFVSDMMPPI